MPRIRQNAINDPITPSIVTRSGFTIVLPTHLIETMDAVSDFSGTTTKLQYLTSLAELNGGEVHSNLEVVPVGAVIDG